MISQSSHGIFEPVLVPVFFSMKVSTALWRSGPWMVASLVAFSRMPSISPSSGKRAPCRDEVLDDAGVLAAGPVELVGVFLVIGHRVVHGDGQRVGFGGAQLGGFFLDVAGSGACRYRR
ncbi:hypothetical protein PPS11_28438 [Pseudomonas putida S11]|nr:hypothetical protein PPS11_28438 [Pseudomonas putida S11]